ncbi:MAG: hypothetical protein MR346_03685 [Clostridium sp.]|nr:hypothetical protein [Clostridium sp.]
MINYNEMRNLNGQILTGENNEIVVATVNCTITKDNINSNYNTCNIIGNEEIFKSGMEEFNAKAVEIQKQMNSEVAE